jgi:DNA polymerase-3 subunit epsilon
MREIVLDTETTGLDPAGGHRIVEIGCIELVDQMPTRRDYHEYINPEMEMPEGALEVHGLTTEFLSAKPRFAEIVESFLGFIGSDTLVVHNAPFDIGFLNAELERLSHAPLPLERAVDTVLLARRKFPGAPANLDALCKRFGIDNSRRTQHGALLDAELLAEVYLELLGVRQNALRLGPSVGAERSAAAAGPVRAPRAHGPSAEEAATHAAFIATLKHPIWED